jgi:hypothetical protein
MTARCPALYTAFVRACLIQGVSVCQRNAMTHGQAPVYLHLWAGGHRGSPAPPAAMRVEVGEVGKEV